MYQSIRGPILREPLDYLDWKRDMIRILQEADLESYILPGASKRSSFIGRAFRSSKSEKDDRAKVIIREHVGAELSSLTKDASTASATWAELAAWFKLHLPAVIEEKRFELNSMRLDQYESTREFNAAFVQAIRDMRSLGEAIPIRNVIMRYVYVVEKTLPVWASRVKLEARFDRNFYTERKFQELMCSLAGEDESGEFVKRWLQNQDRTIEIQLGSAVAC